MSQHEAMTRALFEWADKDGDGFLSRNDLNRLQQRIGGPELDEATWGRIAKPFGFDPSTGMDYAAFARGYSNPEAVEADYKVFAEQTAVDDRRAQIPDNGSKMGASLANLGLSDSQLALISEGFWQMGVLSGLYKRGGMDGDTLINAVVQPYFEDMALHDNPFIAALGADLPEHPSFFAAMETVFQRYSVYDSTSQFMETAAGEEYREGLQGVLDSMEEDTRSSLMHAMAMLEVKVRNAP